MTDFHPGDWVRIDTYLDETLDGHTGTITREHPDWTRDADTMYTVQLDKPLDDGSTTADVWGGDLELLQPHNIIAVVNAPDGAAVAAVHDPGSRCVDVICSTHPDFLTFVYDRGTTETARDGVRADAAKYAEKHAATKHATDALDRS